MTWYPLPTRAHVGVVLPTREALSLADGAGVVVAAAERAEALGFDSVWAGDSLLARPLLDPLVSLAAVATRTSSIRLGTGVLLAPLHQSVLTARALASLDQLSDGRLIVGVGRGFDLPETRREFAAAGVDFDGRTERLVSTIRLWRALWDAAGEPVTDAGPGWAVDDVVLRPRPLQPGGPPIWLAGFGPASFRRAADLADGWLPYPPSPDDYRQGLDAIGDRLAGNGRAVTPAVMVTVAVHDNSEVAEDQLRRYVHTFYGYPQEVVGLVQAMVAGPSEHVVEVLSRYWAAGARAFVLRAASLERPIAHIERLAGDVLPALRALASPGLERV